VNRPSPTSMPISDEESTMPITRNFRSAERPIHTQHSRLVVVVKDGLYIPKNSFRTSKHRWSSSKSMVKLGRERIILSIFPFYRLRMPDTIGISSSLPPASTRMKPLHHPIQGVCISPEPIHLDDNLLPDPRDRLSPDHHNR